MKKIFFCVIINFLFLQNSQAASVKALASVVIVSDITQVSIQEEKFFNGGLSEEEFTSFTKRDFLNRIFYKIHSIPNSLASISYLAKEEKGEGIYKITYNKLLSFNSRGDARVLVNHKELDIKNLLHEVAMLRYVTINY